MPTLESTGEPQRGHHTHVVNNMEYFPNDVQFFWDEDEIIQVVHASQIRTENHCFSPREEVTMGKIIKDCPVLGMNMELQHPREI